MTATEPNLGTKSDWGYGSMRTADQSRSRTGERCTGEQMTDAVLVTGALALVGTATVKHLAAQGRHVVATDLDTPANRRSASTPPAGVRVHQADLTDPEQVGALLAATTPASVIHLAAVKHILLLRSRFTGQRRQRFQHPERTQHAHYRRAVKDVAPADKPAKETAQWGSNYQRD